MVDCFVCIAHAIGWPFVEGNVALLPMMCSGGCCGGVTAEKGVLTSACSLFTLPQGWLCWLLAPNSPFSPLLCNAETSLFVVPCGFAVCYGLNVSCPKSMC